MKQFFVLISLLLFVSIPAWAGYDAVSVEDGGWITGKIGYAGIPPVAKKINATSDKAICGKHGPILSEELVVSPDSGLQNAIVYISNITSGRSLFNMPSPVLEQSGCTFRPHVLVVPVGKTLTVRNQDGILHNIHTHSAKNRPFNVAQAGSVPEISLGPFTAPELVKVACDVHGWMSAWLWVTDHPYAVVTGTDGRYKISDVPPGKYRIEVWSETLGKLSGEVSILSGKESHLNLSFPAPHTSVQTKK